MNSPGGSPWKWIYVQIKHLNFQEFIANKTNGNKTLQKKSTRDDNLPQWGSSILYDLPSFTCFLKATIQSYFQKCLEPATGSVLYKKLFLKISQNSRENTVARVISLIKMTLLKKGLWQMCFPVNFVKFLQNSRRLLLSVCYKISEN